MKGNNSALDIAKYIVRYSNEKSYEISNLRLQKLLYFVQGQFIIERNQLCFDDEIEAWKYGPVVPEVYSFYKNYGSFSIEERPYLLINWDSGEIEKKYFDDSVISEVDKVIVNLIVDNSNKYSVNQLVDITHKQEPWKNTFANGQRNIILKSALEKFFSESK